MRKLSDNKRITIVIFILFSVLCLPVLLAPPKVWLNLILLMLGMFLPFLIVGLLLNRLRFLQNPYAKFFLSWLAGGVAFLSVSSAVLFISKFSWPNIIGISAKVSGFAMGISLLWYVLSIILKKFFSRIRKRAED